MRFLCANGLVLLRICAPSEEHWLQKMRLVGSNASFSLTILYTWCELGLGSMEESFAENQKHQRVAKTVCSVSTNRNVSLAVQSIWL